MGAAIGGLRVTQPAINYPNNKLVGTTSKAATANFAVSSTRMQPNSGQRGVQAKTTAERPNNGTDRTQYASRSIESSANEPITQKVAQAQSARRGWGYEAAHGGDRAAKPPAWKESEWENSIQAIDSAFKKKVNFVELDLQLNTHPDSGKDGVLYLHHNSTGQPIDAKGRVQGLPFGGGCRHRYWLADTGQQGC